jgi:hypothetical protein
MCRLKRPRGCLAQAWVVARCSATDAASIFPDSHQAAPATEWLNAGLTNSSRVGFCLISCVSQKSLDQIDASDERRAEFLDFAASLHAVEAVTFWLQGKDTRQ